MIATVKQSDCVASYSNIHNTFWSRFVLSPQITRTDVLMCQICFPSQSLWMSSSNPFDITVINIDTHQERKEKVSLFLCRSKVFLAACPVRNPSLTVPQVREQLERTDSFRIAPFPFRAPCFWPRNFPGAPPV